MLRRCSRPASSRTWWSARRSAPSTAPRSPPTRRSAAVDGSREVWHGLADSGLYSGGALRRVRHLARTRTHVHPNEPLRALLTEQLGDGAIEDLAVPFQCVAASIERAAEHWFDRRPARRRGAGEQRGARASCRRCAIGDEHFLDGGLVNSIPVGRR